MKTLSLHHLVLTAALLASIALAITVRPAHGQQTATKWIPTRESIIVRAAPTKNWRVVLTASHLGEAFIVSASMPVPYSDLNLAQDPGAAEFGRRIHVAAHLVCQQLDLKYPPTQYPIVDGYSGYECERATAKDGMSQADTIIASAKR